MPAKRALTRLLRVEPSKATDAGGRPPEASVAPCRKSPRSRSISSAELPPWQRGKRPPSAGGCPSAEPGDLALQGMAFDDLD